MSPAVADFLRMTSAVLTANLLTIWFVYSMWKVNRAGDRQGRPRDYLAGLFVLLLALAGVVGVFASQPDRVGSAEVEALLQKYAPE